MYKNYSQPLTSEVISTLGVRRGRKPERRRSVCWRQSAAAVCSAHTPELILILPAQHAAMPYYTAGDLRPVVTM